MKHIITLSIDIPDELVAFVNALGALGNMKQDLGLVADKVSKAPEADGDIPAEVVSSQPAAPSVSFEDLRELIVKVTANPDKRDRARAILTGTGFGKISEVKDKPEMILPLYAQFTELLNAA